MNNNKVSKTVALSPDVWDALYKEVVSTGLSRSVVVQIALKEKLGVTMNKSESAVQSIIGGN